MVDGPEGLAKKTNACNEATETELNPGLMHSIEEHQNITKGEAAVMPVGEPRKRRRVCNLAAERPPEEEGKGPGKTWIQEEVGCRLQEGFPPFKSSMEEKEPLQESSDPKKVRTVEGICRRPQRDDPLCKNGTAQG
jgi:hypothetical protein